MTSKLERKKLYLTKKTEVKTDKAAVTVTPEVIQPEPITPEFVVSEPVVPEVVAVEPVITEPVEPVISYAQGIGEWQAQFEAVVGLSHRNANPPLPCQDAALSVTGTRPLLIVADGAGSSAVSDIGSQAVVTGLARLFHTLEKQCAILLDQPQKEEFDAKNLALLAVKHAKGVLDDLAAQHRRPQKDFRCTLLLALVGKAHILWLQIGDGALVQQRMRLTQDGTQESEVRVLGMADNGEFANQTTFIDEQLKISDVQIGLIDATSITALAAMSDGAAEKLVANNGFSVAKQVDKWFAALREQKLQRRQLTRSFYSDGFCQFHNGDDCSIALLARTSTPPPTP